MVDKAKWTNCYCCRTGQSLRIIYLSRYGNQKVLRFSFPYRNGHPCDGSENTETMISTLVDVAGVVDRNRPDNPLPSRFERVQTVDQNLKVSISAIPMLLVQERR